MRRGYIPLISRSLEDLVVLPEDKLVETKQVAVPSKICIFAVCTLDGVILTEVVQPSSVFKELLCGCIRPLHQVALSIEQGEIFKIDGKLIIDVKTTSA